MTFSLTSSAFKPNETIPRRHTCDGENLSPTLDWSGAPKETKSFVLVCTDPDAPAGVFHHWAVYDIPAVMTGLSEAYEAKPSADGPREAVNDFRNVGYGGPCPPRGHGTHHYHFRLIALDEPHLSVSVKPTCHEVIKMAQREALATAELVGVYERK